MARYPEKISVCVTFPSGFIHFKAYWWQSDKSIIRDACERLGALAPSPEDCAVEREES